MERSAPRLRVLVVAPFPLRLDARHGGSRVVAQLVSRLAARHVVGLLVLRDRDEAGVDDGLRRVCDLVEEVEIPPVGRSIASRVARRLRLRTALLRGIPTWAAVRDAPGFRGRLEQLVREWRPDVVQLEYRITGQFLPPAGCSVPCVVVEADPAGPQHAGPALLARLEARAWHSLGVAAFRSADAVVVFTERDRSAISSLAGSTPVVRIPLGYDLSNRLASPSGAHSHGVLFVGSFVHPPNVDAARWLVRDIFPSIRARVPTASLRLVGSQVTDEVRGFASTGIEVGADVPDLSPFLDAAAVFIAPIRQGGGMRVKVLEALAAGKAIVATPLAVEGLDLEDGGQLLVAETAAGLADHVVDLLTDVERRRQLGTSARRWAEDNLDLEAQVRAYEALYADVVGSTA